MEGGGGTDPGLSKESRVSLGSHKGVERAPHGLLLRPGSDFPLSFIVEALEAEPTGKFPPRSVTRHLPSFSSWRPALLSSISFKGSSFQLLSTEWKWECSDFTGSQPAGCSEHPELVPLPLPPHCTRVPTWSKQYGPEQRWALFCSFFVLF